jgi:hypothetical protein
MSDPYKEDEQRCGLHDVTGRAIEQHPLITGHVWERLRRGEVRRWSYTTIVGSHRLHFQNSCQTHKVIITKEDAP